jgi:hypothetical protein
LSESPERQLLVAILSDAVFALNDFSEAWPTWHTHGRDWQGKRFDGAAMAYGWLHSDAEVNARGFTFAFVAEMLGFDPEAFRESLFKLLDPAALEAIQNPEVAFPRKKPKVRITPAMIAIAKEDPAWLQTLPAEYREGIQQAMQAEALSGPPRPELVDVRADSRPDVPALPGATEGTP